LFIKYGNTKTFEVSKSEEFDTRMEFTRQRQFLEQSIISLKKRVNTCEKKNNLYYKLMEENIVLIDTINKLRQELKANSKKYDNLKSITKQVKNNNLQNQKTLTNFEAVE